MNKKVDYGNLTHFNRINWAYIESIVEDEIRKKASIFRAPFQHFFEDYVQSVNLSFSGDIKETIKSYLDFEMEGLRLNLIRILDHKDFDNIIKSEKDLMFLAALRNFGFTITIKLNIKKRKVAYGVDRMRTFGNPLENIKSEHLQTLKDEGFISEEDFLSASFGASDIFIDSITIMKWLNQNVEFDYDRSKKIIEEIAEESYNKYKKTFK